MAKLAVIGRTCQMDFSSMSLKVSPLFESPLTGNTFVASGIVFRPVEKNIFKFINPKLSIEVKVKS